MPTPTTVLRVVEYALLSASVCLLARDYAIPWVPSRSTVTAIFAICIILLTMHRWRRELIPAYAALVMQAASNTIATSWSSALWYASAASVALALVMVVLFPLPDLTRVYGSYQTIGCHVARYGGVECRVFYPSAVAPPSRDAAAKHRARYLHHGQHLARGLSYFSKVPTWFFNNLSNARLAALEGSPLATTSASEDGKWPLVLFSHGIAGSLELYSAVTQQLASEGYIVVVVNHTDGSASVARGEQDDQIQFYQHLTPEMLANTNGEGFRFRHGQLQHRVKELRSVVAAVSAQTDDDPILGAVDTGNMHVVGHSFGAATALTAAHEDTCFRTAVLLDAWMEPVADALVEGMGDRVPVLHLVSDHFLGWTINMDRVRQHARGSIHAESKLMVIHGTRHNNFSDLPLFSPIINRVAKSAGSIHPSYMLRLVGQLTAAFLQGSFLDAVHEFPEVVTVNVDEP